MHTGHTHTRAHAVRTHNTYKLIAANLSFKIMFHFFFSLALLLQLAMLRKAKTSPAHDVSETSAGQTYTHSLTRRRHVVDFHYGQAAGRSTEERK